MVLQVHVFIMRDVNGWPEALIIRYRKCFVWPWMALQALETKACPRYIMRERTMDGAADTGYDS